MNGTISGYQEQIIEILGCTPDEASLVEDIMRDEVFHSTLDWQSAAQFKRGAFKAWRMFNEDRAHYAGYRRQMQEAMRDERAAERLAEFGLVLSPVEPLETGERWQGPEPEVLEDQKQTVLNVLIASWGQGCRFHIAPCKDGRWFVWAEIHDPPESPTPCDAHYGFYDGTGKAFATRPEALAAIYAYAADLCEAEADEAVPVLA
jgi:hypothetical protein